MAGREDCAGFRGKWKQYVTEVTAEKMERGRMSVEEYFQSRWVASTDLDTRDLMIIWGTI